MSHIPKWYQDEQDKKFKVYQLKRRKEALTKYVCIECTTGIGKSVGNWAITCIDREIGRLAPKHAEIL
jgi:uncharacterized protein (UPF0254 family)